MTHWRIATIAVTAAVAAASGGPEESFEALFGEDYRQAVATRGKVDDVALAQRLLTLMQRSSLAPPMQALLCEKIVALTKGTSSGAALALEALERRAKARPETRLDCLKETAAIREEQLRVAAGASRRGIAGALVAVLCEIAEAEAEAGQRDAVAARYERAVELARYYGSSRYKELAAKLAEARRERDLHAQIAELAAKLKADPADDAARTELVHLHLIDRDDPEEAARCLTPTDASDMAVNVRLAARGMAGLGPAAALRLAQWYAGLAEGLSEERTAVALQRAVQYYHRYLELHRTEDLARAKATMELARLERILARASADGEAQAQGGRAIDLLAQVRISRDRVHGPWSLSGDALKVDPHPQGGARLTVPVAPRGDYELLVVVSRFAGDDSCNIGLPVGRTHVTLIVDGEQGTVIGLGDIGKIKYFDTATAKRLSVFANRKPHTVLVQVRTRGSRAQITVRVDGRTVIRWVGDRGALQAERGVLPDKPHAFLVGSTRTGYLFHKIQLRMLTGDAAHLYKPSGR